MEWGTKGKASVLVDGQFGSTGKGLMAAWLAMQAEGTIDIATCNAGAQAGHTTVRADGSKFVCYHLPTTAVMRPGTRAYVNAGSIVDPVALDAEITQVGIDRDLVLVDPRAAYIEDEDRIAERDPKSSTAGLASTQKGVGHALSRKVMRQSALVGGHSDTMPCAVGKIDLNSRLAQHQSVVVEVPQGLDLSINHGLQYPYTTSRDCWVGSGLSDAGIHPSFLGPVAMVVRTYPIRVGMLYNEMGEKIGDSGPFYPDSAELDWARNFPGIEPERTTVTQRVRRIATWSDAQYAHGLRMTRPSIICLNFCNYLQSAEQFQALLDRMEAVQRRVWVYPSHIVFGFGPALSDVTDNWASAVHWFKNRSF